MSNISTATVLAAMLVIAGSGGAQGPPALPTQEDKLTTLDAAEGDCFGGAIDASMGAHGTGVALSGDTAVIGCYRDDHSGGEDAGSAYVFVRTGTSWVQQFKLTANDAAAGDEFGLSVAVSGDTAVIGARYDDHAGGDRAGSAYVFVRNGTVWTQQTRLAPSDAEAEAYFGTSVALSGDTAVIGAPFDTNDGGVSAGSAYVFVRSGTTWTQQAKLTASDPANDHHFGWAVAASGGTVLVGANNLDPGARGKPGAAYVFVGSGSTWTEQTILTGSDAVIEDAFGGAVGLSGNTAVVGAHYHDYSGLLDPGAAYVFVRTGTTWTEQAKLLADDAAENDLFGSSVAVFTNRIVVGATGVSHGGVPGSGSAYAFARYGTSWTQQAKLPPTSAVDYDAMGISAAMSGDTTIVGAGAAGTDDAGAAYVFRWPMPESIDLTMKTGTLLDKPKVAKDSFKVAGTFVFNEESYDSSFDPSTDAVMLTLGDLATPIVVEIPAGDAGWKGKNGKFTWKSAKKVTPKALFFLDSSKLKFKVKVTGFDFELPPQNPLQVTITAGDDSATIQSVWTEKGPYKFTFP